MSDEIKEIDDEIKDDVDIDFMIDESETYEIEITDDDKDEPSIDNTINYDDSESELDVYFKYGTNNHKLDGKHSLKRDTILNGRLVENSSIGEQDIFSNIPLELETHEMGDIPLERGSSFEEESKNAEESQMKRKLAEDVYDLLRKNTELDFRSNRRKPNKSTFNNYYKMLLNNVGDQYTNCDIFTELAYYFTDNIFNMFKLLDKKYAMRIIKELRGKGFLKNLDSIKFK